MLPSASSAPTATEVPEAIDSGSGVDPAVTGAKARVDFAVVEGDCFLVYGWVLGFSNLVKAASIHFGGTTIDLMSQSWRVHRPDVALHFSKPPSDDLHGFYALVGLTEGSAAGDHLRFTFALVSGETHESLWPVERYGQLPDSDRQSYTATFALLLRQLPRHEARRLIDFVSPEQRPKLKVPFETLPPPIRLEIDLCCLLEDRVLLVYGWTFDPANELKTVKLSVGGLVYDLFENSAPIPRQDIGPDPLFDRPGKATPPPGFVFVKILPPNRAGRGDIKFSINADSSDPVEFARPLCMNAHESRQQLFSILSKLDDESAMALAEHVASVLDGSAELNSLRSLLELSHDRAVEHFPTSVEGSDSKCQLFLDRTVSVANEGIFLSGWFYADKGSLSSVVCHCGGDRFAVSDNWIRHPRQDVTSHLSSLGIQTADHEHGFTCYVPLKNKNRPYYLSIASEPGAVRKMRVPVPEKNPGALQAVRALLSSFLCGHRELRELMDRQIGPAVQAIWSARAKPRRIEYMKTYGGGSANPAVSVIVPLYGRCDLAEYQMALFADDKEFQDLDLIYVVDDPAIFEQFRDLCPNLYGIYQVPFTIAYCGENQGFAAANNFGAEKARGQHLLLLNSDVMPKRRGWIGELLRIFQSLDRPGLLGAKLLFEDGSLQHAGMAFRRFAPLGGLWVNDHPQKGQSAAGFSGTRESDAVTGACALIEAELYRRLGGFSEDYIVGDFEDSDLCLRALKAGRRNYVALDVELYHLERQSQEMIGDAVWRRNLTAYNCWLHNGRWSDFIERTNPGLSSVTWGGGQWWPNRAGSAEGRRESSSEQTHE
jgi:GT2 family glycosyltransferase